MGKNEKPKEVKYGHCGNCGKRQKQVFLKPFIILGARMLLCKNCREK